MSIYPLSPTEGGSAPSSVKSSFRTRLLEALPLAPGYLGYCLFHLLAAPWLALRGLLVARKRGYHSVLRQRLTGCSLRQPPRDGTLFISAHMGETRTALLAAEEMLRVSAHPVAILTHVPAAYAFAHRQNACVTVDFAPFNNPISVLLTLLRWRPRRVLFVECCDTHHLVFMAKLMGIQTGIINVRLSEYDCARQRRRSSSLWRFRAMGFFAVQAEAHRQRLRTLGVEDHRIVVTGPSLALPQAEPGFRERALRKWQDVVNLSDATVPVLVAGSTHPEEEGILLDAFLRFRNLHPRALLILAPRSPNRACGGDSTLRAFALPFVRRSEVDRRPEETPVLLLDTFGELQEVYSIATAAFIGGTFRPEHGGHTPTEALAWGAPLTLGPEFEAQRTLVELLEEAEVATICRSAEDLAQTWSRAVDDPEWRETIYRRSAQILEGSGSVYQRLIAEMEGSALSAGTLR